MAVLLLNNVSAFKSYKGIKLMLRDVRVDLVSIYKYGGIDIKIICF